MADPITIAAMGSRGVNVDTNPLLLDDSELRSAQNLYHNPSEAQAGGLRTRKGFRSFIAAPFTGPVLGGIGLAVAGTALATGAGGGLGTGESVGPADAGSAAGGGPGSELIPGGVGGGSQIPGVFNPSGALFGGARLVVIGRDSLNVGLAPGDSWFVTSENLANTAVTVSGANPPNRPHSPGSSLEFAGLESVGTVGARYNEWFLYPSGITDRTTSERSTLRKTNGFVDQLVYSVPINLIGVNAWSSVLAYAVQDRVLYFGVLYLCVAAGTNHVPLANPAWWTVLLTAAQIATGSMPGNSINGVLQALNSVWFTESSPFGVNSGWASGGVGRLGQLNPDTNQQRLVSLGLNQPGPLAAFMDKIFVGIANDLSGSAAEIYVVTNTDPAQGALTAVLDPVAGTFAIPHCGIGCMATYSGSLYAGTSSRQSGVNKAFAKIYVRDTSAPGTGIWSTSFTASGAGAVLAQNDFCSMAVFSGNLYAAFVNSPAASNTGAAIFKFDGTTWTKAWQATGSASERRFALIVDQDTLYALGTDQAGTGAPYFQTTANGTSWTQRTTISSSGSFLPFGLLFGFDQ